MKIISTLSFFALLATGGAAQAAGPEIFTPSYVAGAMRKVADWQINSWTVDGFKKPKYNWTYCAAYTGIFALGDVSGDAKYHAFLKQIGTDLGWDSGKRRFFADDYCVGQVFATMYMRHRDPAMLAPFKALADQIIAQPHTESLSLATRDIMEREWAWCDALFMGPTSLTYLYKATGEIKYLDIANQLWWKTTDYLYDKDEHLYFRDQSYFDKREKNGKKVFWSRGNGWVMGGLVRVLSGMPENYPDRPRYIKLYREMAARLVSLQQPDGSWHSSLLDPDSYPVKETSGTGFYTYAILWGLNNGLLDEKTYWPAAAKGWTVLSESVRSDGMLGFVQPVGAAPARVNADSTETYGPGAFLLAGSEMNKYLFRRIAPAN
ncbi:MAG: glycoside hydrolase family 88 protein [Pseudomonadota bacterium]